VNGKMQCKIRCATLAWGHTQVAPAAAAAAATLQIAFGLIACLAVMYACSPAQLLLWGWRVPFLLTAFFAPIALILRMHMPEPHDFLVSKQV
jgi:MFS family permease